MTIHQISKAAAQPLSASMQKPQTVRVLDTPIALVDEASFVQALEQWLALKDAWTPGAFVCFRDVHGVVRARDDDALRLAHEKAFMNAPDGMPLVWVARRRSGADVQRVAGMDMLPAVCRAGVSKGWRHVFMGGTPDVLAALTASFNASYPGITIADEISPPFRALSTEETDQLLARIRAAKPDFVWVGLGSPKQELWMAQYAHTLPGAISMGVGGAFDTSAGVISRSPLWMQRAGLEWLFRIMQEPRRLTRRYFSVIPRFLVALAIEEMKLRRRPK